MANTLQDLLNATRFDVTVSEVTLVPCKDIEYLSEVYITENHSYIGLVDTEDWEWAD